MSERAVKLELLRKRYLAGAVAGIALMGGLAGPPKAGASESHLPRCYDAPQPALMKPQPEPLLPTLMSINPDGSKWQRFIDKRIERAPQPIHLRATPEGIVGDPRNLPASVDKYLATATVEVESYQGQFISQGSGFITRDAKGEEVVVTAAHVYDGVPLENISVTNDSGFRVGVDGGCYMFENLGRFEPFDQNHLSDFDIAVLKLNQSIGSSILWLSQVEPRRGQWVYFKNYQEDAPIKSPATYAGIVTHNDESHLDLQVLTGLQYWRDKNYALRPGGSGGPAVNKLGQVVGMSFAASAETYESRAAIKYFDNVTISGLRFGRKTKLMPVEGWLMPARALAIALDSPRA